MSWTAYQVILRLHAPLHIGRGRVSYLQRARPYVTGRVLRGALVSRVGRNNPTLCRNCPPNDPYRRVSKTFGQFLTFTYFYPALEKENEPGQWEPCFPWQVEARFRRRFRRRFLSSYTAVALDYPHQTAAEGLLYETEFISPYTLDDGKPVYLMGYIFVVEGRLKCETYDWKAAFCRIQLGGERGYGWGEARLVDNGIQSVCGDAKLFNTIRFDADVEHPNRPVVHLEENQPVLAHTTATAGAVAGAVEPVVGREWRAEGDKEGKRRHIGQNLAFDDIRFVPGSVVTQASVFSIGEAGYWQRVGLVAAASLCGSGLARSCRIPMR